MKEGTYQEEYDKFWKRIVENPDGTLNKDQVMRELSDYLMVIDNCERAYDTMTESTISKANTKFYEVEEIFNEKYFSTSSFDIYGCKVDLEEIMNDCETLDELKREIRKYFEIEE
jgi:ribosomal protein S8